MKKFLGYYDKAVDWLCGWGSDKYLHLIAGLIISYVFSKLFTHAWVGLIAAFVVGVAKELADKYIRHHDFGKTDLAFTVVGGLIGMLMYFA